MYAPTFDSHTNTLTIFQYTFIVRSCKHKVVRIHWCASFEYTISLQPTHTCRTGNFVNEFRSAWKTRTRRRKRGKVEMDRSFLLHISQERPTVLYYRCAVSKAQMAIFGLNHPESCHPSHPSCSTQLYIYMGLAAFPCGVIRLSLFHFIKCGMMTMMMMMVAVVVVVVLVMMVVIGVANTIVEWDIPVTTPWCYF